MASNVKYFNTYNQGITVNNNEIYQSDITNVLETSISRRKITDAVFTNELSGINMNNIQSDAMEFQVGGFNPMVSSIFCEKLFNTETEQLALQLNNVSIDTPVKYMDVIIHMRDKMNFLMDGGTDCVLCYLIKGTTSFHHEELGPTTPINWSTLGNHEVLILPVLSNKEQFDILLQALNHTLQQLGGVLDSENTRNLANFKPITRIAHLQLAWKQIVDAAYSLHTNRTVTSLPNNMNIYMIDFFNKVSINGAELLRKTSGLLNLGDHLLQVNLRQAVDIYEEKTRDGGLAQNELGAFSASSLGCSEGIFYPQLASKTWRNTELTEVTDDLNIRKTLSSFLYTENSLPDNTVLENLHKQIYNEYFPQNFDTVLARTHPTSATTYKAIAIEGFIPFPLSNSDNINILKVGLARFYPFCWIVREDAYPLGGKEMIHIWNNRSKQLKQVIDIYGYYGIQSRTTFEKEEPIDYSNLFGECSLVIPQAKSLKHNMRIPTISSVVKFDSFVDNIGGERYYIPRLLTPTMLNIWDKETSLLTPMQVYILTQKFGSKPPFHPGSKLNMIVSLYAYKR